MSIFIIVLYVYIIGGLLTGMWALRLWREDPDLSDDEDGVVRERLPN